MVVEKEKVKRREIRNTGNRDRKNGGGMMQKKNNKYGIYGSNMFKREEKRRGFKA